MQSSVPREGVSARRGAFVAGEGLPSAQIAEMQRARLLAGALAVIEEHGYGQCTVQQITTRARVSRRTFYELFENREECLLALLEDVLEAIEGELLATAGLAGVGWRERVRGGLEAILGFFDREPALARVCVVQALRGGPRVLERREEVLARLAAVVDEGRGEGARGAGCSSLTAEGLVGAAFGIVYARLLREEPRPLGGLVGELMSLIVLPYLGPAAARRELAREAAPAPAVSAGSAGGVLPDALHGDRDLLRGDPLRGVPMRMTLRTARVLDCIWERPGASNRMVAERAGVIDPGQISKLLSRLEGLGLIENSGGGHTMGEPNAWSLTATGLQVAQSIRVRGRVVPCKQAGVRPVRSQRGEVR